MANVGDLSVQLKADDNASSKISDAAKRINGSLGTIKKGAVIASAAILGGFTLSVKQLNLCSTVKCLLIESFNFSTNSLPYFLPTLTQYTLTIYLLKYTN